MGFLGFLGLDSGRSLACSRAAILQLVPRLLRRIIFYFFKRMSLTLVLPLYVLTQHELSAMTVCLAALLYSSTSKLLAFSFQRVNVTPSPLHIEKKTWLVV